MMEANNEAVGKPTQRRRRIWIALFILIGLVVCLGISLFAFFSWGEIMPDRLGINFNSPCSINNRDVVEGMGKFKLPPNSTLLYANCSQNQGTWSEAHFSMPPDALKPFLATTHIQPPLSSTNRPAKLICDCDDIQVSNYLYGTYRNTTTDWQEEIFIDTHDKNLYTVYFTVLGG